MAIRHLLMGAALAGTALLPGCGEPETGPIIVSAIGSPPRAGNPNLQRLDPASEHLLVATAQGLVTFNAEGQIEPALAQSWIVSDDGLRYTFRLARTAWRGGEMVTAEDVVARLEAARSAASRNPLKPMLAVVDEIVAMTDDVLEISLTAARPNFLQLLAQPEMTIAFDGAGTGPFHAVPAEDGAVALHLPDAEEEIEDASAPDEHADSLILRGERAALAVARFAAGRADLVSGGTIGDLPIVRAARPGADALRFDPAAGLFGLAFVAREGALANPALRRALSMAIDRAELVAAFDVPDLQPRETLLPRGIGEVGQPAAPAWASAPLPMRRALAEQIIAGEAPLTVRIAMPDGPGHDLLFAHLRRDWSAIGVDVERVAAGDRSADLRLIDRVAPVEMASWYLRQFSCDTAFVCDPAADEMLAAARIAPTARNRQALLANADRILADATPFIALAAPIRWSLVSPRLTGFRTNAFARHNLAELIAAAP